MIIAEIKSFLKRWILIYGFTMLATLFFMEIGSEEIIVGKDFFEKMVVFSTIADIPPFVFYSKHELDDRELLVRQIICIILELLFLLPLGHCFGMWEGIGGFAFFSFVTILITLAVRFTLYGKDVAMANRINDRLKEIQSDEDNH